ncbi:hypothetical protein [Achromobacter aegrifaciens]
MSSFKQHKGLMAPRSTSHEIKIEPMFFRAEPRYADAAGSWMTRRFLMAAKQVWGDLDGCLLDTRWHYLMPGMYPCIPGWHVDDAPRDPNKWGGQPDLWTEGKGPEHLLCVVDAGTGSLTQFLTADLRLSKTLIVEQFEAEGTNFYQSADALIERSKAMRVLVTPGDIVEFDSRSWHRGMPATGSGFRWFARLTRGSHHKPVNEIRTNSQVYLTATNFGW